MKDDIRGYVSKLKGTSVIKTIWYNFFSGKLERHVSRRENDRQARSWTGLLLIGRDARIKIGRGSRIKIYGLSRIGYSNISGVKKAVLDIGDDATLELLHGCDILSGSRVVVMNGAKMSMGRKSSVNDDDRIICTKSISIGDEVTMAPGVTIRDSMGHKPGGKSEIEPVVIGDHVWLTTGVTVLSGVTIGDGSIVAAHAVVDKSIPESSLAAGVPAKKIKGGVYWEY